MNLLTSRALRVSARGVFATVLLVAATAFTRASDPQDLSGTWHFALDERDVGVRENWFNQSLKDAVRIPGILQDQGFGDEINKDTPWVVSLYDRSWYLREPYKRYAETIPARVPFLSQPRRHYLGVAWYQREIEVPSEWRERYLILFLERARWESTVWIDGKKIGSENTLVAPHEFELGQLSVGRHRLTVRLDNRDVVPGYRPDSHAVSDALGSTWNGIAGRVEIRAVTSVSIDQARVFPDLARGTAKVEVTLLNRTGAPGRGKVSVATAAQEISWSGEHQSTFSLEVPLPAGTRPWSEFDPALQRLAVRLEGDGAADSREVVFGARELRTSGTAFLLNGREIQLRGTHHGGDFPLTGYPAMDVEYWRNLLRVCRRWGLNHLRFHSWCPPEAAFLAADELGFYLQPECGMWNDFEPNGPMEKRLYSETERLLRAYGNHPSLLLLSPSNEPGGQWKASLPPWVSHFRQIDPRHLYTAGTGWSLRDQPGAFGDKVDYLAVHRIGQHVMRGKPGWFGKDYDSAMRDADRPNLTHEVGQWCAYPDFSVISKFTGYLRPGNYEIFRDSAAEHGLLDRNAEFAKASGLYQLNYYKEDIEANLRSKKLRGFQLLDLHDYLGQGTALVGLLDAFWGEKGYVSAEQFRRFCSETVPLTRLTQRIFVSSDTFRVPVEISHFGAVPLTAAVPYWKIEDSTGKTIVQGEWPERPVPIGNGTALGTVEAALSNLPAPGMFRLVVGLRGLPVENDWKFWVYPAKASEPAGTSTQIVRDWTEAETALAKGERVLFLPRSADLSWTSPPLADVPVFWNRMMGPQWSRMLGLWCDASHPALADFPTESFCDWQWSNLVAGTRAINLDGLPAALRPIVQPIDDWNRNYRLGVIFECRVGPGKLLVCAADLTHSLEKRPVARQLRVSLLHYLASDRFQPAVEMTPEQMRSFLFPTDLMRRLGATVMEPGLGARAIDGDPTTTWLSGRSHNGTAPGKRQQLADFVRVPDHGYPHVLTVQFPTSVAFSGLMLMPRQDHREHLGDVRGYRIAISDDGSTWTDLHEGELPSSFEPKTIPFGKTVTARALRFTAVSGFRDDSTAALAELAILYEGPPLPPPPETGELRYQNTRSATPEIDEGGQPAPSSS